ncbi:CaiB/BaiF CoA transferase family protein [Marmoricola sp. RAF53]|uniref:CaiB/BaiF CoA transferase family protein n=1 Tax=Marmoricola sp. RAF53 TaxID=3233059 RepID=UPI003F982485
MTIELGQGTGPLQGIKVIEIAGIGPSPHACMILADLGADVIRIERPGGQMLTGGDHDLLNRGRPSVALNLKDPAAVETVLQLVEGADVLVEGMRPGVTERMGIGPDDCFARNPKLVYGRMTGWGQTGAWAHAAGHDMNYIAITGTLFGLGQDKGKPQFPTNLVGDFGGGSMYLVVGILAALLESKVSGKGQVVDAAIVDGTANLNAMTAAFLAGGTYREERAANLLDGGAPYYDIYETADGKHMSVGSLEPQFYEILLDLLEVRDTAPDRWDFDKVDELRAVFTARFKEKTQAEWCAVFDGTDACVAPIIPMSEAFDHPHMKSREVFVEHHGYVQPAPAPRFSRTGATLGLPPAAKAGAQTREGLLAWGVKNADELIESGAAVQAD